MPYIKIEISKEISETVKKNLVKGIADILSKEADKSEEYLMIKIEKNSDIWFRGEKIESAYIGIKLVGELLVEQKSIITDKMCRLHEKEIGIESKNIYITFAEISGENWGNDGKIFA
jgi:phenylpyruvate tautomerase PptA (4-oxalocrotonate tautomerase family)